MESQGYVYCFSNPSFIGIVKIGMTTRYIEERLQEANHCGTWGPPTPYVIEFAKKVNNPREKEKIIHRLLEKYSERVNTNREFFKISVIDARLFFDLIDGEYWNKDTIVNEHENVKENILYEQITNDGNENIILSDMLIDNINKILNGNNVNSTEILEKAYIYKSNKYNCELCKYYTDRKQNYELHIESEKHKYRIQNTFFKYICKLCNKKYQSSGGLSKHKRKCISRYNNINKTLIQNTVSNLQEILEYSK
jgi:hypothetical protein